MVDHFPFMSGTAKTGHYKRAFAAALEIFKKRSPGEIASTAGVYYDAAKKEFTVPSYGTELAVTYPEGDVFFKYSRALPLLSWRIMTVNYLGRSSGKPLSGQPASYRELDGGNIFYPAFYKEAVVKLVNWLPGKSTQLIEKAALSLCATRIKDADLAFVFYAFPRFPVTLQIWLPDDELPGSANVTFDTTANEYLHTEDIAVAGSFPTSFMIKTYQSLSGAGHKG